jgi:hypothetical protein
MVTYGSRLPVIDEVSVLTLVETDEAGNMGAFTVPYTNQKLFIRSKTLAVGVEAQQIGAQWRKLNFGDGGAACFEPHHVLQFRHQQKVICESIVCFHCGNLTLPAFPSPILIGFNEDGAASPFPKLKSLLEMSIRKTQVQSIEQTAP